MSFLLDLCNLENPHGFCYEDSCLFKLWFVPLITLTMPLWIPLCICQSIYEECKDCQEWSKNNEIEKEIK